jgi:phage shock protein E
VCKHGRIFALDKKHMLMLNILKSLFGSKPAVDFKKLVADGAQILDVRTRDEYKGGHVQGSKNIPLQELAKNLSKLKKDKPIITYCASGMRSASAKGLLKSNGFTEVHNGGSWKGLHDKLK